MQARRLKYALAVMMNGHLANPLWHSSLERRQRRGRAIREAAVKYLSPYAHAACDLVPYLRAPPRRRPALACLAGLPCLATTRGRR